MANEINSGQPTGTAQDMAETRAALKKMRTSPTACAANPPAPGPVIGSAIPAKVPKKRVVKKPPSGSGAQPPSDGGGSGGGGSGSGGSQPSGNGGGIEDRIKKLSVLQLAIIGVIIMIAFTFIAAEGNSYFMRAQLPVIKAQQQLEASQLELETAKLELESKRKGVEAKSALPATKPVGLLTTFPCENDQEKKEGFAKTDIQNVDRQDVSFRANPGCAWVIVSVPLRTLAGTGFLFNKDDSSSTTGYSGCGTFGTGDRKADSPEECGRYFNRNQGVLHRLIIENGGVVFFN